jgi:hypothetical protein
MLRLGRAARGVFLASIACAGNPSRSLDDWGDRVHSSPDRHPRSSRRTRESDRGAEPRRRSRFLGARFVLPSTIGSCSGWTSFGLLGRTLKLSVGEAPSLGKERDYGRIVRRRQAPDQKYRGTRDNVPPRIAFPMRKRAVGAFRKSHVPRTTRPRMRSAPQALDSHPPRSTLPTASYPSPRPGMRMALAGAVRHPSTHDTDWSRDPRRRRVGPTTATRHRAHESPVPVFRSSRYAEGCDGLEAEPFHPPT